jgi:SAM-dependent methyltransferase
MDETNAQSQKSESLGNFDDYAADYTAALAQGLSVSGESQEFFAEERVKWLAQCLRNRDFLLQPSIIDFGCGTGASVPFLRRCFAAKRILGVDVSFSSLEVGKHNHGSKNVDFSLIDHDHPPENQFDLAFCNGVFHHIPVDQREAAVRFVWNSLRPGGYFAFWENNPWNIGTRYIMSRIPFDRDAVTLSYPNAISMLKGANFEILDTNFLFIFPHALRVLRPLEGAVSSLPLGAQYLVLCRKAESGAALQ